MVVFRVHVSIDVYMTGFGGPDGGASLGRVRL